MGIEINKNPFLLSSKETELTFNNLSSNILPSPYIHQDIISKNNYINLFIEHQIEISDRLSLNFEGTLDVFISDTAELVGFEAVKSNNFYPEISLYYQFFSQLSLSTTINYYRQQIEENNNQNKPLDSEIYQGIEFELEKEFNNYFSLSLSFYRETQNNFTIINPIQPNFYLQINQQIYRSWTAELNGEINPNWWIYAFYSYEDQEISLARHNLGIWTSYQITQGSLSGWGLGAGVNWKSDNFTNYTNESSLSNYLQIDAAMFYVQDQIKAAISIENLFNSGDKDDPEVVEQAMFGTIFWQF
ncbi:putative ferrichrome iron receptor precursor [Chondrocystis sp. NIES-4102]|nr:putative ferrichrome iron receptor precursor [Chondrocystis sp. NIES-4102]